jgi:hypothetical protein
MKVKHKAFAVGLDRALRQTVRGRCGRPSRQDLNAEEQGIEGGLAHGLREMFR